MTVQSIAYKGGEMKAVYIRRRIVVAILLLLALVAFNKVIFAEPSYSCTVDTVVVMPGDTLWDLSKEYCDDPGNVVVDKLIDINGTYDLSVGQIIRFPQSKP